MRARHARSLLPAVIAVMAVLAGCGGHMAAPDDWLPEPVVAMTDGFGGWVEVDYQYTESLVAHAAGELIAVEADSLYLISSSHLVAVSRENLISARAELYDPHVGNVRMLAAVGGASALSHGFFFPVSLLVWTIAGSAVASARSQEPTLEYPDDAYQDLARYARFPQGVPSGIRSMTLTPRYTRAP